MSTTKDILENAIDIEILPTTAPDMDMNEDRDVELEQVYIINVDTFDNNDKGDGKVVNGSIKGSFKDSNTVRQEMLFEPWLEKECL